jgi:GNAT superfamily N-acetyltransferase
MRVDLAREGDLGIACELLRAQFDEHSIALDETSLEAALAGLAKDRSRGFVLLAHGAVAIGLACVAYTWTLEHGGKSAWLDELYVRAEHRGAGVGTTLLRAAVERATREGCRAIDLEVDRAHRRAERLYTREGFRPHARSRWARSLV